ncbi:hypothetical protein QCA50_017543 [Cerrena zonata]|uniref:Xylanolytic transcriptional activator regulatory domain-containing protein n=1 Tax=Cerrena zonata TaxID=2478898 RepID=A0AAW0FKP1_9APHY
MRLYPVQSADGKYFPHARRPRSLPAPADASAPRLKLRCSRVFPCASCVKKGCAAICPNDSLTTGKGNRFVLANTEELHDKISVLANRIRQLEDGLQEERAARGLADPHPLLAADLLRLKRPLERESSEALKEPEVDASEAIDAVGSLSISDSGHSKFFGHTANAWYLLQIEEGQEEDAEDNKIPLPSEIPWLNHTFPVSSTNSQSVKDVQGSLMVLLPEVEKARRLAELYFRHAAWMYTPIPETEFYQTVFCYVYYQPPSADVEIIHPHGLAVLFLVFALGSLLDLEQEYLHAEASQYYQLGRAALSLDSVLESQSIPAIQALLLMSHYMFLSFIEAPRWAIMGLAVKIAQSVGLHRDSEKWKLDPEEAYRRRSLMWELYTYDSWQSLTFGRPPSFSMAFIDSQMAEETTKNPAGEIEMTFAAWKHRYSSRCLAVVHEQAFGARTPSYKMIQELDKKIRNFYVPPSLRVPGFGGVKPDMNAAQPSVELTMQRHVAFAIKEISIFYLHRGFFAKAVEDHPDDPLGSKYAPSFLAAYNSACSFVGLVKSLYSQHPRLTERMWFLFTHVFSCTIVLGSIATKCPGMALARSALSHLESACNLFETVTGNDRAAKVVPVLQRLKAKALQAMSDQNSPTTPNSRFSPDAPSSKDDSGDELNTLGGRTRLVSRKSPSAHSSPAAMHGHSVSPEGTSPQQTYHQIPPTSPISAVDAVPQQQYWPQHHQPNGLHIHPETYNHYGYPLMSPDQWNPEVQYNHMDTSTMAMEDTSTIYYPYDHSMGQIQHQNGYAPARSPVNHFGQDVMIPGPEPEASWRSLMAQLNPSQ